jgi:anti-anti-sigma regulatory factor
MEDFIYKDVDNTLLCVLNGRYGADENDPFARMLSEKIENCRTVIAGSGELNVCFDLKTVTFVASAFIRTCLATSRHIAPGKFSIINSSPMIKKTFVIAGLDKALNVS